MKPSERIGPAHTKGEEDLALILDDLHERLSALEGKRKPARAKISIYGQGCFVLSLKDARNEPDGWHLVHVDRETLADLRQLIDKYL